MMNSMEDQTDSSGPTAPPRLSKSKFLSGLQCLKRVYLEIHKPFLATPPDAATRALLAMGHEIGLEAQRRFPGGVPVSAGVRQREAALARTATLIEDPAVPAIFEGAFESGGVFVRVDILERKRDAETGASSWRLIEVKSSTRVKDLHLSDLAIQSYVLLQAGIRLAGSCLMHINTGYRYGGGDLDLEQLFAIEDVSEAVAKRSAEVSGLLTVMKERLTALEPPDVEPGSHCLSPYACPFWAHCTKEKPDRWIYRLSGPKAAVEGLARQGISTIDAIPPATPLTPLQRRIKDNVEWISPKLKASLESIRYPVHHLDFETIMPAVPRFAFTRPYQAVPMQWSNHIEDQSGAVIHHEFLHDQPTEPRRRWAESLIESLGEHGTICVYSPYEQAVIKQMIEDFPDFRSDFRQILKRLWDLQAVIQTNYYHPDFGGSYSLKSVLPAMARSVGYDDLTIRDGGQAAAAYHHMVFVETDWIEQAATRDALRRYCARDTWALVQVRHALSRKVSFPVAPSLMKDPTG
ncbi:conserved protein of unknown function [Nitrospira japonica]|uniref:DUF2779 domain-containing protein n=2 Tax=Nitrospira japonica TaxID=1325564 RepID=A0A1W1I819_9BACT|nr:conserved protein of unknown function [Nitrospira japonica]